MRLSWQAHNKTTALDKSPKPPYREKEKAAQGKKNREGPCRESKGRSRENVKAKAENIRRRKARQQGGDNVMNCLGLTVPYRNNVLILPTEYMVIDGKSVWEYWSLKG